MEPVWHAFQRIALAIALAALAGISPRPAAAQGKVAFVVIANAANPVSAVERQFVREAFLKRTTTWPGGTPIAPVDLDPRSTSRAAFSDEVLERSVEAVKSYWQQMIFSGRAVPPPELESDEEVVRYVASRPGGLGYVSASADLSGVKILAVK